MTGQLVAQELTYFQEIYLKARRLEGKLYHDDVVRKMPNLNRDHPYYEECRARKDSLDEMNACLTAYEPPIRILEVGCGNGWMANALTQNHNIQMVSLELHEMDAQQDERVYGNKANLRYRSLNSFLDNPDAEPFDIILFSGSFQYFGDAAVTLSQWMQYLKPTGEIHIKDTLVHDSATKAQELTKNKGQYFRSIGVEPMANYFTNYSWDDFKGFNYVNHRRSWIVQVRKTLTRQTSLNFPWIIVKK